MNCLNFGSSYFLFLGFRVYFREGDKDDLEQECPAEIVLVLRSLSYRTLIVRYSMKHFLLTIALRNHQQTRNKMQLVGRKCINQ